MGASLYEPINVYKPVAPDVGIVDGPIRILDRRRSKTAPSVHNPNDSGAPFRSPFEFDRRLANGLLGVGTVRHLVSPNQFHYAHIGNGQRRFPMQSRGHRRVYAKGRVLGILMSTSREILRPIRPKNGVEKSTKRFFPVVISRSSSSSTRVLKTLILADTIINLELDKITEPWRTVTKVTGMYQPFGQIFFGMRWPLLLQRHKAQAAIRKIYSWQPRCILLSHGRYFDSDTEIVISRIFGEPAR